jgi:hypothetical protein
VIGINRPSYVPRTVYHKRDQRPPWSVATNRKSPIPGRDGCTFKEAVNLLTGGHTPPQKPATGARHGAAGHRDSGGAKAADNAAKAAWLWSRREPISEDCPAGLYLRRTRGYHGPIPPTLGYLPPKGKHPATVIATFGFCDEEERVSSWNGLGEFGETVVRGLFIVTRHAATNCPPSAVLIRLKRRRKVRPIVRPALYCP